jgi:uncharacterized protein (TIGR00255 family)
MTGYGKAIYFNENIDLEIEIKSLNNRFIDIRLKLPTEFAEMENSIGDLIRRKILRGKVEVKFNLTSKHIPEFVIDEKKLENFAEFSNSIQEKFKSPIQLSIEFIMNELNLIKKDNQYNINLYGILIDTLEEAIQKHQESALAEGNAMKIDILNSMKKIEHAIMFIETIYPLHKEKTYALMKTNIEEMISDKLPAEKLKDIAVEAAIYYEKNNVNEEIKRFLSHLNEFMKTCNYQTDNIGKRLQFIIQEMQREVNTIGSKFCTEESFNYILICKEELEKCREMIQNVE